MNDVHHRSPGKSFLQPLVSLRGLVGSDRWVNKDEALEVMDPSYSSSVHVRNDQRSNSDMPSVSDGSANFGGIENSVDTSWSFQVRWCDFVCCLCKRSSMILVFQYGTYPFLGGEDDAVVFLGQCFLLGEELTPLLVNMRGVVEQVGYSSYFCDIILVIMWLNVFAHSNSQRLSSFSVTTTFSSHRSVGP